MEDSLQLARKLFIECNWSYDVSPEDHYGYFSIMSSLQKSAKEMMEAEKTEHSKVLKLLARAASMMLTASSLNEPFTAYFQLVEEGKRSALPEDFSEEDLVFFEDILNDVNEPYLKARLADLLWLLRKPRNPDYARVAIDSYISNVIDDDSWHRGVNECWERATRLCIQIKEFDRLNEIKGKLFSAFLFEYPRSKFMLLWIAGLLDKLNIDNDFKEDIASSLHKKANDLKENGDFYSARSYFELVSKKYQQCSNEKGRLESFIAIAECFELEADSRASDSNMAANSFYENAIQAYRRVPTKHRDTYGIEGKITEIRTKMTISGQASLGEMGMVKTPGIDISEIIKSSIEHVAGKHSPEEALMYFTGLFHGAEYEKLAVSAKKTIQNSFFSNLFESSRMSSDGRIIARTPAMNLRAGEDDPANKAALHRQIHQQFSIQVQLVVEGQIMPALRQLCMEHRVTKELMVSICHDSPIVPNDRVNLLGDALWLGFEYEFGSAIHLLCPQIEHIVRSQLKEVGAHTSNIDKGGIENENGLSTLMELPEAVQVFGENLTFEIKSIFTESLGYNLRNQVAHGLLDDDASSSIATVYAWWMILRLVIRSIIHGNIK
ncbi:DUF4209 domain-containing protein [Photorhabdus luminescens]|uniref:DUF4209 domain-containing protein n=1 Tax=Photorhabdus luminescens subsp. sonorensis TaxID=1173677 RepID=A0A5C4RGJ9_PHOLU|nr:DUF4209 domain-containing protein [Photorhabdus luminescens]TNH42995.1 DUF4209 domain-containing protein [Photorhabdus luminescens subsp. sonorensis]